MGSFPSRLNPACSGAVSPVERPLVCQAVWERTSCNWQSISPFPLYSHPWQINHNQMLAEARGTLRGREEKWGLMLVWQPNRSTHPIRLNRGHCGLPVTTTTHKQTVRSASWSLADPIRASLGTSRYPISQCCRERRRPSSCWGRDTGKWVACKIGEDTLAQQDCVWPFWKLVKVYCRLQKKVSVLTVYLLSVIHQLGNEITSRFYSLIGNWLLANFLCSTYNQEIENTFKNVIYIYARPYKKFISFTHTKSSQALTQGPLSLI